MGQFGEMLEVSQQNINHDTEEESAAMMAELITFIKKSHATEVAKRIIIKKLIKGLLNEL